MSYQSNLIQSKILANQQKEKEKESDDFDGYLEQLQSLDLSNKNLGNEKEHNIFQKCTNLLKINLSYNRLSKVMPIPASLQFVALNNNLLQGLDENIFRLKNLILLDLSNNFIEDIDNFQDFPTLKYLFLRNNKIKRMQQLAMKLPLLVELDIQDNNIESGSQLQAFKNNKYLEVLNCRQNPVIEFVEEANLGNLPFLINNILCTSKECFQYSKIFYNLQQNYKEDISQIRIIGASLSNSNNNNNNKKMSLDCNAEKSKPKIGMKKEQIMKERPSSAGVNQLILLQKSKSNPRTPSPRIKLQSPLTQRGQHNTNTYSNTGISHMNEKQKYNSSKVMITSLDKKRQGKKLFLQKNTAQSTSYCGQKTDGNNINNSSITNKSMLNNNNSQTFLLNKSSIQQKSDTSLLHYNNNNNKSNNNNNNQSQQSQQIQNDLQIPSQKLDKNKIINHHFLKSRLTQKNSSSSNLTQKINTEICSGYEDKNQESLLQKQISKNNNNNCSNNNNSSNKAQNLKNQLIKESLSAKIKEMGCISNLKQENANLQNINKQLEKKIQEMAKNQQQYEVVQQEIDQLKTLNEEFIEQIKKFEGKWEKLKDENYVLQSKNEFLQKELIEIYNLVIEQQQEQKKNYSSSFQNSNTTNYSANGLNLQYDKLMGFETKHYLKNINQQHQVQIEKMKQLFKVGIQKMILQFNTFESQIYVKVIDQSGKLQKVQQHQQNLEKSVGSLKEKGQQGLQPFQMNSPLFSQKRQDLCGGYENAEFSTQESMRKHSEEDFQFSSRYSNRKSSLFDVNPFLACDEELNSKEENLILQKSTTVVDKKIALYIDKLKKRVHGLEIECHFYKQKCGKLKITLEQAIDQLSKYAKYQNKQDSITQHSNSSGSGSGSKEENKDHSHIFQSGQKNLSYFIEQNYCGSSYSNGTQNQQFGKANENQENQFYHEDVECNVGTVGSNNHSLSQIQECDYSQESSTLQVNSFQAH